MAIKTFRLHVSTTAEIDIIDSTLKLEPIAEQAGTGALLFFVPGSTAALKTFEYESGAVAALRRETYPMRMIAALLGPLLSIPVVDGRLLFGMWQKVVVCDCPVPGKLSCSCMHRPSKPLQS